MITLVWCTPVSQMERRFNGLSCNRKTKKKGRRERKSHFWIEYHSNDPTTKRKILSIVGGTFFPLSKRRFWKKNKKQRVIWEYENCSGTPIAVSFVSNDFIRVRCKHLSSPTNAFSITFWFPYTKSKEFNFVKNNHYGSMCISLKFYILYNNTTYYNFKGLILGTFRSKNKYKSMRGY